MWARVSATYLYPIKACAPMQVPSLAFESTGDLRGDRAWVVVDADDRITWQGAIPALAQIKPTGTPDQLAISSATGGSAALPPAGQGVPRTVYNWNGQRQAFDAFQGHDAGDPVAQLASMIAGKPVRLVHLATTGHRPNAVHFISTTSLSTLSAEVGGKTDLLRFRPNVVLSSDGDALPPFAEEEATSLVCSHAEPKLVFTITGPCERCIVINVDPVSSAVDGRFLKVVASHSQRRGLNAPAAFGIYARTNNPGTLATGDRIELVTT
jgi:uncharacterized protein YcbX